MTKESTLEQALKKYLIEKHHQQEPADTNAQLSDDEVISVMIDFFILDLLKNSREEDGERIDSWLGSLLVSLNDLGANIQGVGLDEIQDAAIYLMFNTPPSSVQHDTYPEDLEPHFVGAQYHELQPDHDEEVWFIEFLDNND